MSKPNNTTVTFDKYLVTLSKDQRTALQKVRKTIQAVVPEAVGGVSYGLPAFLVYGKAVAALSASKQHCSYFPMSGHVVAALAKELKGYDTSKGTIRFTPDKPLPATLVKKLTKARLAEIAVQPRSARVSRPRRSSDRRSPAASSSQTDSAVIAFLKAIDHPLKKEIETVRKIILSVSPEIQEGIKWNAPSFRTTDYFATFNLRSTEAVQLIFHTGAKVKETATKGMQITDSAGLLKWLAKDRCMVTIGKKEIQAKRKALGAIIRQWIDYLC